MKRALKGELPLMNKLQSLQNELLAYVHPASFNGVVAEERHLLAMAKNIFLMLGGLAVQKYQLKLEDEQELLADLADMMILIYAAESALARALKLVDMAEQRGSTEAQLAVTMSEVFTHESFSEIERIARQCLATLASGDTLRTQLSILKKLTRRSTIDLNERK